MPARCGIGRSRSLLHAAHGAASQMPDLRNCENRAALCGDEARRPLLLTVSPADRRSNTSNPLLYPGLREARVACPPSPPGPPTHVGDNHSGYCGPTTVTHYRSALTPRCRPAMRPGDASVASIRRRWLPHAALYTPHVDGGRRGPRVGTRD
ncbi:Uncharacterized protein DBV15_09146, partial [Temnothorax longispinosus]